MSAKQMTKQVQAGVRQRIRAMESPKSVAIQFPLHAPIPEGIQPAGSEPLDPGIPQAEVQFQGHWKVRIKIIAAPLPAGLADQRRQMIEWKLLESANGFITQRGGRGISSLDSFGTAKQVEIVLDTQFRIGYKIRAVRETLQHQELDAGIAQSFRDFLVNEPQAPPPLVVGEQVALEALPHPFRRTVAANR